MVGIYFSGTGNSRFTPRMGLYKVETLYIQFESEKYSLNTMSVENLISQILGHK